MNKYFLRLLVLPCLGYLFLTAVIAFLLYLYHYPLVLLGDFLRFSLPFLVLTLIILVSNNRRHVKKLRQTKKVPPHTPVEATLIKQLTQTRAADKQFKQDLLLRQRQQIEQLELFSHEIKNYLAILKAAAESSEQVPSITIKSTVQQADYYLDLLLNDERLTMESNDFDFQWVNLKQLVNDVLQQNATLFIQKQLVPQLVGLQQVKVLSDRKWLRFCLNQLLSNAIKYSAQGGLITIAWKKQQLIITDEGCGILASDLPRIFENGFTGHNGHQTTESTGMGLYLVKKVAKKLNFTIKITSQVDDGTQVYLNFPADNVRL